MVATPPTRQPHPKPWALSPKPCPEHAEPWTLTPDPCSSGFTLLELLIVMTIIAILAVVAIPAYVANVRAAREAVLREDLHAMRTAIDSFTVDKQKGPTTLDDIVQAGYLRAMPKDPMTNRTDTWITAQCDAVSSVDQTDPGICDVHSGAQQTSSEGTAYTTW